MEIIIKTITSIIACFCLGRSLFKIFSPQPRLWKRLLFYYLLKFAITMPSWIGDENPILLFPFFMIGFLLLLSGDKLQKLIIGGIFYALLIPINMLLDSRYWGDIMLIVTMLCKTLVLCALAWFLIRIVPEGGLRLSKKLGLMLGGLTLAPLMAMMSFSIWGNNFRVESEYQFYSSILQHFSFTILPFVMVSAFALLITAVVLSKHETLEQQSKLVALREVYYTGLKQEQARIRTLRHDLRNHVTVLQGLLEQGKQTELFCYLTDLADSPALDGGRRYSQNETANVVFCSKVTQMEASGFTADFHASLPESLPIPAPELCALLGNALDNAIEGAAEAKNRTITLQVRLARGVFMLNVQNAIGSKLNADLSTTKKDTVHHGYGLAGMREIAQRHGGYLDATAKDGRFELLVCFPCGD